MAVLIQLLMYMYMILYFPSCVAGEDYEAVAPTDLTFDMSMGSDQMIGSYITILNDTVCENIECFYVVINSTDICFIDRPMARVCIYDDDST